MGRERNGDSVRLKTKSEEIAIILTKLSFQIMSSSGRKEARQCLKLSGATPGTLLGHLDPVDSPTMALKDIESTINGLSFDDRILKRAVSWMLDLQLPQWKAISGKTHP
jgi:hypothetical protein